MSGGAPTGLPDVAGSVALYGLAADYALDSLGAVALADLDRPTPCPGWDLRTLITHVGDAAEALATRAATGEQTFPALPAPSQTDPVPRAADRLRRLSDALSAALASDENASHDAARAAALAGAIEFAAHGWDVAVACNAQRPVPTALAPGVLAVARALVKDPLRARFFAPAVQVSGSADDGEQFVAFAGRDPSWAAMTTAR